MNKTELKRAIHNMDGQIGDLFDALLDRIEDLEKAVKK